MMQKPNRRILAVLAFVAIIIILAASILLARHQNKAGAPNLDSGQYYDANSGQTISNPPGKAPDTFGTVSDQPVYLGFGSLLDYGISDNQVTSLKAAFYAYTRANKIKEVSISVNTISSEPRNPKNNDPFIMDFNVVFDRKTTYKAKMDYTSLDSIHLFLYNSKDNNQIYDSGVVGSSDGE